MKLDRPLTCATQRLWDKHQGAHVLASICADLCHVHGCAIGSARGGALTRCAWCGGTGELVCLVVFLGMMLWQRRKGDQHRLDDTTQDIQRCMCARARASFYSRSLCFCRCHSHHPCSQTTTKSAASPASRKSSTLSAHSRRLAISAAQPWAVRGCARLLVSRRDNTHGDTLADIGLLFISSSIYQMLRGAIIIFTGFMSVRGAMFYLQWPQP